MESGISMCLFSMRIPVTQDSESMRSAEALFDLVDDTVFFVKDSAGRYTAVSRLSSLSLHPGRFGLTA